MMELLYILSIQVFTQVNEYIKIYRTVHNKM